MTVTFKSSPSLRAKYRRKRYIFLGLWALWLAYLSLTHEVKSVSSTPTHVQDQKTYHSSVRWRAAETNSDPQFLQTIPAENNYDKHNLVAGYNCTNPSILDFPTDLFTQSERQAGAIVVHFLASLYIFYSIAIVCNDYFVPSIEIICEQFNIPSDVAGATFMAIATSAPELFTNVIGTFITKGDIGLGTILGSAVFNILAICTFCGFAASTTLPLDWYPLTRDCIFYSISVVLLIVVLEDQKVFWYEALVMVLAYCLYIAVMWKNTALRRVAERTVGRIEKYCGCFPITRTFTSMDEKTPLLSHFGPCTFPRSESVCTKIIWFVSWPARFIFTLTIPDCQKFKFRRFYPFTFIMCMVYIALLTYVVSWLMTVIGHTLGIPDSVMGLTFIAAGTSVPEAVSSIIVARQGLGSMSISDSIGSNTVDILICLGLPWLIRASMIASDPANNFIKINSGGLEYSAMILIISLVLLYGILALNSFNLDKKVATLALALYAVFIVLVSLLEMNVFFMLNQPTCSID